MREVWIVEGRVNLGRAPWECFMGEEWANRRRDELADRWPEVHFYTVRYVPAPAKKPKAKKRTR